MDWTTFKDYIPIVIIALLIAGAFELFERVWKKPLLSKPAQKIAATVKNVVDPPAVFSFPFVEIRGAEAAAAFERAKTEGKGIPLLIGGGADQRQALADMMKYRKPSVDDYLRMATQMPNPFNSKTKPQTIGMVPQHQPLDEPPFLVTTNPLGVTKPEDLKPVVTLAYIPAKTSADIPAFLKLGGWNGIVEAEVFVALLRKWQRDYGAELVAITMDAMDVRITRKPASKTEALALAREHQKFCHTNEATVAEIADGLLHTKWWHFYWD